MFPDLKHAIMSPLAMQTVAMRVCTKCHKKTLVWRCSNDFGVWMQCEKCLTVFVLPPDSTDDALSGGGK